MQPVSSILNLQVADATPAGGAQNDTPLLAARDSGGSSEGGIVGYFENWFPRVEEAQASQPHWMTPIVTVTPRLEQEYRYDQYWEQRGNGSSLDISDAGKGLELIPTETNEVLINPPAWQDKEKVKHPVSGWLDDQFLVVKQRLLSANEENGNYIVTAFLGVTAPSGNTNFTNKAWIVTPTIAGGMGWGDFDFQATTGVAIPFRNQSTIGYVDRDERRVPVSSVRSIFWPEFEMNHTYWAAATSAAAKTSSAHAGHHLPGRFRDSSGARQGNHRRRLSVRRVAKIRQYVLVQTPEYNRNWI